MKNFFNNILLALKKLFIGLKIYFSDKRNWYHVLIGSSVGYDITLFFGFNNRSNFPLDWTDFRTMLAPVVGGIIVGGASFFWEKRQDSITPNVSDVRDVACSGISALIGGIIALFFANLVVAIVFSVFSLIVLKEHYKK